MEDEVIYHYCSLQSFFDILKSKELWLTSLNSTNDSTELIYGKEILNNLILNMIEESDADLKKYLHGLVKEPKDIISQSFSHTEFHGMSFVHKKDNLTHWQKYGCNGTGICISLNLHILNSHIFDSDIFKKEIFDRLAHFEVIYDKEKQEKTIKERLLYLYESTKEHQKLGDASAIIAYSVLLDLQPYFKNECFSDEKEYRLVLKTDSIDYFQFSSDHYNSIKTLKKKRRGAVTDSNMGESFIKAYEFQQKLEILPEQKKYEIITDEIRSYYSLNLESIWNSQLIPEIIIGPHCNQNEKELNGFLKNNGFNDTKITKSSVPTRTKIV
jgi:Protein of unknown function (DUF2971).